MGLKPQNIMQAADADIARSLRNAHNAAMSKQFKVTYEQYAFHRNHVRRADTARELIVLALMDPIIKTAKKNTRLIYGDGRLLVDAARLAKES
jgi:hypothetical protein